MRIIWQGLDLIIIIIIIIIRNYPTAIFSASITLAGDEWLEPPALQKRMGNYNPFFWVVLPATQITHCMGQNSHQKYWLYLSPLLVGVITN